MTTRTLLGGRPCSPPGAAADTIFTCKAGHPLSGANLHVRPDGKRRCRACDRERKRRASLSLPEFATPSVLESLNRGIDRSDLGACWPWTRARSDDGYGRISNRGSAQVRVHRLVWQLLYEVELGSHQHVLHHCDNPPCCNPDHLFVGRHIDNMADMVAKGRHAGQRKTSRPAGLVDDKNSPTGRSAPANRGQVRRASPPALRTAPLPSGGEQQSRTGSPSPAAAARPAGIRAGESDVTRNRLTPRPTTAGGSR